MISIPEALSPRWFAWLWKSPRARATSTNTTGSYTLSAWIGFCILPYITRAIMASSLEPLASDGDPMDVLALVEEPTFSGCVVEVRPVGVLNMVDQKLKDQKIVAVLNRDPRYQQVHTLDQIFPHLRREIEHFFNIYKELEGRETSTLGWGDPIEARNVIAESRKAYLARKGS